MKIKTLPSIGFILIIISICSIAFFLDWVYSPLAYVKADKLERKGHIAFQEGRRAEALQYFLAAAKLPDDMISRSRRYRCAAYSTDGDEAVKYFKLALQYNPENELALKAMNSKTINN